MNDPRTDRHDEHANTQQDQEGGLLPGFALSLAGAWLTWLVEGTIASLGLGEPTSVRLAGGLIVWLPLSIFAACRLRPRTRRGYATGVAVMAAGILFFFLLMGMTYSGMGRR